MELLNTGCGAAMRIPASIRNRLCAAIRHVIGRSAYTAAVKDYAGGTRDRLGRPILPYSPLERISRRDCTAANRTTNKFNE